MALSRSVLKRIQQWEAIHGRPASEEIIRGFLEAELEVEASRQAQTKQVELQERGLSLQEQEQASLAGYREESLALSREAQEQANAYNEQRLALQEKDLARLEEAQRSQVDLSERELGLREDALSLQSEALDAQMEADEVSGYTNLASTAGMGYYFLKDTPLVQGAGEALSSLVTGGSASEALASIPASAEVGTTMSAGGTTMGASTGSSAGASTGTGLSAGSTLSTVGWGAAAYFGGRTLGNLIGLDKKTSGALGGAAAGAYVGFKAGSVIPGVGNIVGAIVGTIFGSILGGSIICTELYRQGRFTWDDLCDSTEFRERFIDDETYRGYVRVASPVVGWMKKSRLVSWGVEKLSRVYLNEARFYTKGVGRSTWYGRGLLLGGVGLCKWIGKEREVLNYG